MLDKKNFEENRLKILLVIAFILAVGLYFSQDKNINIKIKKIQPTEIATKTDSAQIIQKIARNEDGIGTQNTDFHEELKVKNELTTLYESTDESGRYHIKLQSNTTIDKKKNFTKYIVLSGEIENENKVTSFPMSLNENYVNSINGIFITIDDITKNDKNLRCSGHFLSGLNLETIYQIKINITGNSANCYISSSEPLPSFIKEMANNQEPIVVYTEDNNVSTK